LAVTTTKSACHAILNVQVVALDFFQQNALLLAMMVSIRANRSCLKTPLLAASNASRRARQLTTLKMLGFTTLQLVNVQSATLSVTRMLFSGMQLEQVMAFQHAMVQMLINVPTANIRSSLTGNAYHHAHLTKQ
jgi:hypothetical protein